MLAFLVSHVRQQKGDGTTEGVRSKGSKKMVTIQEGWKQRKQLDLQDDQSTQ